MNTTGPVYLLFIAVCALLYYIVPPKMQNPLLLAASVVFYMWSSPWNVLFIALSALLCFFSAKSIEKSEDGKRKTALICTVLVLLAVLFVFKYLGFILKVFADICGTVGINIPTLYIRLASPLGISFYTFQMVGYILDVNNKKIKAEDDFLNFLLFVFFFPTIICGPIVRGGEMLPQYRQYRPFSYENVVAGMQRVLCGAFRKMVLADGISIIVDPVISEPSSYSGLTVVVAVVLYNFKIYCDFAGYSEMAIGIAKIFGLTLRENFKVPFLATNMADYWKRWHISLTSWLQDYVFTPLVWSRWANKLCFGKKWQEHAPIVLVNIVIVFLISGIWHGAAYGYILWGLLHGLIRVAEELIAKYRKKHKIKKKKGTVYTALGRAKVVLLSTLTMAVFSLNFTEIVKAIPHFSSVGTTVAEIMQLASNGIAAGGLYILLYFGFIFVGFVLMTVGDSYIDKTGNMNPIAAVGTKTRWLLYWLLAFGVCWFYMIAVTGAAGSASFVYAGF